MKKITLLTMIFILSMGMVNIAYSKEFKTDVKITRISDLKHYTDSYIKGEVVRILDEDEFRLKDSSGRIRVYTGWKNTNLVKVGEKITVRGTLDRGIIRDFYATVLIRENGEVVTLKSGD